MKIRTLVWGLVGVIAFSGVARSQSLADVARQEEERRKAIKTPSKVYTDNDLRRYPVTTPPETSAPDQTKAAAAGGQVTAKTENAVAQAKDATPSIDQGEEHWRKLIMEARSALARSSTYLEALQSRVNTLTAEFYAREDSAQRGGIWVQRTRVVDDMERLKRDMTDQEKAIAKIEEDARKANIPPGWIR
jgi:hypothetical protein